MAFNFENLDTAKTSFERIKRKVIELKNTMHKGADKTQEYEKEFLESINDDLNTPQAVQVFIKTLDDVDFDSKKRLNFKNLFCKV